MLRLLLQLDYSLNRLRRGAYLREYLCARHATHTRRGEELEDAASWDGISKVVQKEPFTQESMDLMFRKAAKNLPPNALLGNDFFYEDIATGSTIVMRAHAL